MAQPGTVAIVTGQQVGLFSGPAYTIYKAITAAQVARSLTERGIPAVPVFWLATEDHDFEEVNHAWTFDAAHSPMKLSVMPPAEDGANPSARQRPVGGLAVQDYPVEQLAASLAAFPHGEEVAAMVRDAYQPGVTMGQGFHALLKKLLARLNLIFLDPLDPAIRKISAPLVAKALQMAPELKAALLQRNRDLEAAGYHAQVHIEEKTSLFFLLENGERVPLRRKDSEFGDLQRPRSRGFAERVAAARGAGLSAADRGVRRRSRGAGVFRASRSDLRSPAGANAGDDGAQRVHTAWSRARRNCWLVIA